ncbi:MAG TPA: diguanylate cyclase [Tepidisphaeraceae bacterium]
MARIGQEKVLLIADPQREVHGAIIAALPSATVTAVNDYFDAIAELSANPYTTVFASAEPIERRPEAAVRQLRELTGDGRLILFGQPSLEGLSRKMLDFGVDDYVITPASAGELQQMFGNPLLRVAPASKPVDTAEAESRPEIKVTEPPTSAEILHGLPLADIVLDALIQHPADAPGSAVRRISELIAPTMQLVFMPRGKPAPEVGDDVLLLSHGLRAGAEELGQLHLIAPHEDQDRAPRHFLAQIAHLIGKVAALQDRHNRLQKLAITDQLTGVYNRRYFEHFLTRILEKARVMRFPVTLLLFDIDDFKKYNDTYGHGAGDQILKETATLMRRTCREHDLVARIGGDEFAVVFWEKEGPRQPKGQQPVMPAKPPQSPRLVFERFRKLMASQDFPGLGATGKGVLTISGGLASFPWDGRDVAELIEAADHALVKGAKQSGKDRIFLVGENDQVSDHDGPH